MDTCACVNMRTSTAQRLLLDVCVDHTRFDHDTVTVTDTFLDSLVVLIIVMMIYPECRNGARLHTERTDRTDSAELGVSQAQLVRASNQAGHGLRRV